MRINDCNFARPVNAAKIALRAIAVNRRTEQLSWGRGSGQPYIWLSAEPQYHCVLHLQVKACARLNRNQMKDKSQGKSISYITWKPYKCGEHCPCKASNLHIIKVVDHGLSFYCQLLIAYNWVNWPIFNKVIILHMQLLLTKVMHLFFP